MNINNLKSIRAMSTEQILTLEEGKLMSKNIADLLTDNLAMAFLNNKLIFPSEALESKFSGLSILNAGDEDDDDDFDDDFEDDDFDDDFDDEDFDDEDFDDEDFDEDDFDDSDFYEDDFDDSDFDDDFEDEDEGDSSWDDSF